MSQFQVVQVDDKAFKEWLANAPPRIKQAALDGLNRTQEECMVAGKRAIRSAFTERDKKFLSTIPTGQPGSPIPRDWRASTKGAPSALVAIGDGGPRRLGDNRRNILEPFEVGKVKRAKSDSTPIAIPTKALRPTKATVIPKAMHPRYLLGKFNQDGKFTGQLQDGRTKRTKLGGRRALSMYSYFVTPKTSGKAYGIYERTGPKPKQVRMIWAFRDQIQRPAMLRWIQVTTEVANRQLGPNVAGQVASAIRRLNEKGQRVALPATQ